MTKQFLLLSLFTSSLCITSDKTSSIWQYVGTNPALQSSGMHEEHLQDSQEEMLAKLSEEIRRIISTDRK
jgi:hypothetical protein